jgi:Cu/Ag efflux pump CusA
MVPRRFTAKAKQRYIAVKYCVHGRDLGSTVKEAIDKVNKQVSLPSGYHIDCAGAYESQKRSQRRLLLVLPITILLIFAIPYTMFKSGKWALLIYGERRNGSDWRIACAAHHAHKLQRLLRYGVPCSFWRLRTNWG